MESRYSMEREHAIGYTATFGPSLHYHPTTGNFIYATYASIVVRDFDDPHKQVFLRGHSSKITCVAMSKSGAFLASGEEGMTSDVVVWDFLERQEMWRFSEFDGGIASLSFSEDERLLLTIGMDNRVVIWDLKTGKIVCTTQPPKSLGRLISSSWGGFSKDVKRRNTDMYQFATGGDTLCVWVLDPYTGHVDFEIADSKRNIRKIACMTFLSTPDSCGREGYVDEWLLAGTHSGDFLAYLVKPSNQIGTAAKAGFVKAIPACRGTVMSLAPSPSNEAMLVVGGGDGTLAIFTYDPLRSEWLDEEGFNASGGICGVGVSPHGQEIVIGTTQGEILRGRRGVLNKNGVMKICENHCGKVTGISFAPCSNDRFVTCSTDGTVRVWSADDYSVQTEIRVRSHDNCVPNCVVYSIDAIITGWSDGVIRCHHATSGELLFAIENAHVGGVTALCLSNNTKFILSGGEQGDVRMWEMRTRELVAILKEHTRRVTKIVIFDDDVHAISASRDKSFLCWDLRMEKRVSAHTQRMGGINDISLNHDQTLVITMGQEKSITAWDLREPFPVSSITDCEKQGMHKGEATCIAIAHSGTLIATGGMDHTVKLWTTNGGRTEPKLIQTNRGHSSCVKGIQFSYDDRQIVSVGSDGAIFIWNLYPPMEGMESKT